MTAPRVGCAARLIYRDQHQAVDHWWTFVTPQGDFVTLCSAACVLSWLLWGPLPSEAEQRQGAPEEAA
jgi:hypothetical protein